MNADKPPAGGETRSARQGPGVNRRGWLLCAQLVLMVLVLVMARWVSLPLGAMVALPLAGSSAVVAACGRSQAA
ncbi:MAG TPA: hypothetical protein VHI52_15110, partial [Verrucomicrobiae bacterium]|nr:hypothetical protein [Verrucomicrobiae bacterium]